MSPRKHVRFPFVDLSIILAVCLIGWAAFRLARLEPQIASEQQQFQELSSLFKECQELFGGSIQNPELARGEFDLILRDALRLKTEYLSIADRLQADLPELNSALNDPSVQKGRGELARRLIELKSWMEKQKDRAG